MKLYYDAAYGLLFICAGLGIGYFDAYIQTNRLKRSRIDDDVAPFILLEHGNFDAYSQSHNLRQLVLILTTDIHGSLYMSSFIGERLKILHHTEETFPPLSCHLRNSEDITPCVTRLPLKTNRL